MVEKNNLRKQLDTIAYPQTNQTIVDHDHSWFFWLAETNPCGKPLVSISIDFNSCPTDFQLISIDFN